MNITIQQSRIGGLCGNCTHASMTTFENGDQLLYCESYRKRLHSVAVDCADYFPKNITWLSPAEQRQMENVAYRWSSEEQRFLSPGEDSYSDIYKEEMARQRAIQDAARSGKPNEAAPLQDEEGTEARESHALF